MRGDSTLTIIVTSPKVNELELLTLHAHKNTNIERHTAHTIVLWPNPKQWVTVHTSDLMMIIRQSIYIFSQLAHDFELCYTDIRFNQQFIHVMQSAISFEIAPVTYM